MDGLHRGHGRELSIGRAEAQIRDSGGAARARARALLAALNAALLEADSATLTLERWCDARGIGSGAVVAVRDASMVKAPGAGVLADLAVAEAGLVRYRRVRLCRGGLVLSEADNWYVPGRLTASMNRALEGSDVAFGRAVRGLGYRRRTLSAEMLWGGAEVEMPRAVLRHRAVLVLPDGVPISEVWETYWAGVLGV